MDKEKASTTSTSRPSAPRAGPFTRPFAMLGLAELAYFTADGVAIHALPLYVTGPLGSDTADTATAFVDLGVGIGPIGLGFVAQTFGIPTAFAVSAAVALLGGIWAFVLSRRQSALATPH